MCAVISAQLVFYLAPSILLPSLYLQVGGRASVRPDPTLALALGLGLELALTLP